MTTMEKLNETWSYCIGIFGADRCIALTLHGSQNYKCDLPESDMDAKLIVAPTWNEIVQCAKPLSETIKGPYGDVNVTDVRLFIGNNLYKQNFNFLESLFTQYNCVNQDYVDLWEQLYKNREAIAHYDPEAAVHTMMGQLENQKKRWGKFDDTKTLYHMIRISWAITQYVAGAPFEKTLVPCDEKLALIKEVRLGKVAQLDMEFFASCCDVIALNVANKAYLVPRDETVDALLQEIQEQMVRRALYELNIEN